MEQIDYIVSLILQLATNKHYADTAMMQSPFPYLNIIVVGNNYLIGIYAIKATVIENCYQHNSMLPD